MANALPPLLGSLILKEKPSEAPSASPEVLGNMQSPYIPRPSPKNQNGGGSGEQGRLC